VKEELDKLEQDVEQELALLCDLPTVTPGPECLSRVKAAVVAEANRLARRRRLLRWTGRSVGAAAAVLLAVGGIALWQRGPQRHAPDPDAALTEWATALDESNARLASVLSAGGTYGDAGEDENAELDELLRSLDESLQRFENLESG
jgi:hypothetical protein